MLLVTLPMVKRTKVWQLDANKNFCNATVGGYSSCDGEVNVWNFTVTPNVIILFTDHGIVATESFTYSLRRASFFQGIKSLTVLSRLSLNFCCKHDSDLTLQIK